MTPSARNKRNSTEKKKLPTLGGPKRKPTPAPPKKRLVKSTTPDVDKPGQRGTNVTEKQMKGGRRSIPEQKKYAAEQKRLKSKMK